MPIELSPIESRRFGVVIARLRDIHAPTSDIDRAAKSLGIDMLIARVPSEDWPLIHRLEADGHRLMDTLVYYRCRLLETPPGRDATVVGKARLSVAADRGAVADIASTAFTGYGGHYHTDPRLDTAAADAGYVEWAMTLFANASASSPFFVFEAQTGVVGFLATKVSGTEIDFVLNAVATDQQGRGIYGRLITAALDHARDRGVTDAIVSSQLTNVRVQRVWTRHGFHLDKAFQTFHKWYDPVPG